MKLRSVTFMNSLLLIIARKDAINSVIPSGQLLQVVLNFNLMLMETAAFTFTDFVRPTKNRLRRQLSTSLLFMVQRSTNGKNIQFCCVCVRARSLPTLLFIFSNSAGVESDWRVRFSYKPKPNTHPHTVHHVYSYINIT